MKRLRVQKGLSMAEAAALAGFTPQMWNDYEKGTRTNPKLNTVAQIATALDCKARDLIKE